MDWRGKLSQASKLGGQQGVGDILNLSKSTPTPCQRGKLANLAEYPCLGAFHLKSSSYSKCTCPLCFWLSVTRSTLMRSTATRSTRIWSVCHEISCELIWWQLISWELISWHWVNQKRTEFCLLQVSTQSTLPRLCLHFRELFNLKYPVTVDSFVTPIRSQLSWIYSAAGRRRWGWAPLISPVHSGQWSILVYEYWST